MKLQLLVSAVNEDVSTLAQRMNLESDAIIINQTDHFDYTEYEHKGKKIQCYSFAEKGVGLSRNNALLRAEGDIVLFSDEDIVYDSGYEEKILKAFEENKENGISSSIRIVETTASQDLIITDIKYDGEKMKVVRDFTRDRYMNIQDATITYLEYDG